MTTYADVKKQIAQLEKKAADLRKAEVAKVVANIRDQMAKYELTVDDIAPGKSSQRGKKGTKGTTTKIVKPAKYMDPKTGKTWTGHGKAPGWIAAATKAGRRDDFLIEKVNQAEPAEKSKPAKPVAAKKAPAAAKKVVTKKPKAPAKKAPAASKAPVAKKKPAPAKAKPASQAKKVATKAPAKPTSKPVASAKSVKKSSTKQAPTTTLPKPVENA